MALVVAAAKQTGARRIITISAGGIYEDLPEPFNTWDLRMVGAPVLPAGTAVAGLTDVM